MILDQTKEQSGSYVEWIRPFAIPLILDVLPRDRRLKQLDVPWANSRHSAVRPKKVLSNKEMRAQHRARVDFTGRSIRLATKLTTASDVFFLELW